VQLYRQALAYQTRGKVGSGTCIKGDDNFDRRYGPFLRVNVCANADQSGGQQDSMQKYIHG
jgi:hypothetical protein